MHYKGKLSQEYTNVYEVTHIHKLKEVVSHTQIVLLLYIYLACYHLGDEWVGILSFVTYSLFPELPSVLVVK